MLDTWDPLTIQTAENDREASDCIHALATGEIPAIIVRGAYGEQNCITLLDRLFERKLFVGFEEFGRGVQGKSKVERFDIGSSLGNLASDCDRFFAHSRATNMLFSGLFDGLIDPISLLYDWLDRLSGDKIVRTAREADGREYGPAIFRCHMPHWGYPPHVDSVRNRGSTLHAAPEERTRYAVHRFEHQLGGVLLLQSPEEDSSRCDSILYRCEWNSEIEEMLQVVYLGLDEPEANMINTKQFEEYIRVNSIPYCEVQLLPGDLYFFRAECPHSIPKFVGNVPRITMATFFGYTASDPEIYVWS